MSPLCPAASDGSSKASNPVATLKVNGQSSTNTTGGVKRTAKHNRRLNLAERRATHNAVERQRRETLNGRFLDLAALLPNLSQIWRPTKSSIVNSSIAHINASLRHRILAAQELRLLKNEADVLRHEVNTWRMKSGIPNVGEPRRSDGFGVILSGELEFEPGDMMEREEKGEEGDDGSAGLYAGSGPEVDIPEVPQPVTIGLRQSHLMSPIGLGYNHQVFHNNGWAADGETDSNINSQAIVDHPTSSHPAHQTTYKLVPQNTQYSRASAQYYSVSGAQSQGYTHAHSEYLAAGHTIDTIAGGKSRGVSADIPPLWHSWYAY